MHYWRRNNALKGVPWPAAARPPGPGGHYFFTNNALAGILIIIHLTGTRPVFFSRYLNVRPLFISNTVFFLDHINSIHHKTNGFKQIFFALFIFHFK